MLAINLNQKNRENKIPSKGPIRSLLGRSIFSKYFFACASIMVVSFIVLGTAMVALSIQYSNNQKESMYLESAGNISKLITSFGSIAGTDDIINVSIQLSSINLDARIYVCDNTGKLKGVFTPTMINTKPGSKIPASIMKTINSRQSFSEYGTLGGFFDTRYISSGVPVIGSDGTVYGAVIVSSRSGSLIPIISGIFKIFLFCVCMILILAFIAIYFVTARLVKPLRQMGNAAKSFANGDFSARIPILDNDEIGQLSASFNNMASSLTSLEDMRRSFVANVSHELKTPMTSIAGFIDGILDGTIPKEKESYYLTLVSDEVKRLSRLVRSFLDIARIEAGELKISPVEFDVMETVRRVVIGFEKSINDKSLDIRGLDNDTDDMASDGKFMVFSDPDLTHQIIYNLVDNAVKFANPGGYLEINVVARDKKVFIGIKNSGMGIPADELPYVFDRFYKTDKSRSQDRKGVGLGLYIVKTVLNMQGEDISVKSVEGKFCEFMFTLKEV